MATVNDVCALVEGLFPPQLAESWDAVGLVVGRPQNPVTTIMLTVDVTPDTVAEAIAEGADLIIAHHPLLFGGVTSVAATDFKGRIIHDLIAADIALLVAHTNADCAKPGVSDALADALGVFETEPLEPCVGEALDKFVVFVPQSDAPAVLEAMSQAGAGRVGNYDRCAFESDGRGTFRPQPGASPHIGSVGEIEQVAETRLEMVALRRLRSVVKSALRDAHPYEEPAFDIVELADIPGPLGLGRIGELDQPATLEAFARVVATELPVGQSGVRIAGDLAGTVRRVAVCGGSGDSLLAVASARGADVYVTSDLKHHAVSEHLANGGCAVIDVAHFASEFPWCRSTAHRLERAFESGSDTVCVKVSEIVTDPWSQHMRSQS